MLWPPRTTRKRSCGWLDALADRHVAEDLGGLARRPVDLQGGDLVGLADADRLLQRVGAEAAPARHVAVDHLPGLPGQHGLDPGPDGRPVRLLAHQAYGERPVALPRVLEQG